MPFNEINQTNPSLTKPNKTSHAKCKNAHRAIIRKKAQRAVMLHEKNESERRFASRRSEREKQLTEWE